MIDLVLISYESLLQIQASQAGRQDRLDGPRELGRREEAGPVLVAVEEGGRERAGGQQPVGHELWGERAEERVGVGVA